MPANNDGNIFLKNMLIESRKRVVGSLLSYMEQNVYDSLTKTQCEELRQKVLNAVGAYHDTCLDMLKASLNDGSVSNELLLEAIYDIRDEVRLL
jgi:hypothetical protein